jgi:hypothetical protein
MDQKPVESGTLRTENAHGSHESESNCSAVTAQSRTSGLPNWLNVDFAHRRVRGQIASSQALTMKPDVAQSAEGSSESTSIGKHEHVAKLVGKQHLAGQSAKVYDLTVLDEHCFYANGILVSNCGDSVQYFALRFNSPLDGNMGHGKRRNVVHSTYRYV